MLSFITWLTRFCNQSSLWVFIFNKMFVRFFMCTTLDSPSVLVYLFAGNMEAFQSDRLESKASSSQTKGIESGLLCYESRRIFQILIGLREITADNMQSEGLPDSRVSTVDCRLCVEGKNLFALLSNVNYEAIASGNFFRKLPPYRVTQLLAPLLSSSCNPKTAPSRRGKL